MYWNLNIMVNMLNLPLVLLLLGWRLTLDIRSVTRPSYDVMSSFFDTSFNPHNPHPYHPHHPHHSHHPHHPHHSDQVIHCLLRTLFILSATSLPRSTSSLRWLVNIRSGHFCFSGKNFFSFNIVVNIGHSHFCFSGKTSQKLRMLSRSLSVY